jgi:hypothetical protein
VKIVVPRRAPPCAHSTVALPLCCLPVPRQRSAHHGICSLQTIVNSSGFQLMLMPARSCQHGWKLTNSKYCVAAGGWRPATCPATCAPRSPPTTPTSGRATQVPPAVNTAVRLAAMQVIKHVIQCISLRHGATRTRGGSTPPDSTRAEAAQQVASEGWLLRLRTVSRLAMPPAPAAYHDSDFFEDLPAALRGKVARYRTRPCVANSELGQVSRAALHTHTC